MKKRNINWDAVYRSNYESTAFWDIYWLRSARSLIVSAKELEPKVMELWENYRARMKDDRIRLKEDHYQGPYFMLIAFAIENYFKAALVRENSMLYKQSFRSDNKFPDELRSHKLVALAKEVGFVFSLEEEDLLRRLTLHAIWKGRYPVPLNYRDTAGAEQFSDGIEYAVSWFRGDDVERLNKFIESIEKRLGFHRE